MARITLADGRIIETTPEREQAAKDKIDQLKNDETFQKRYWSDNPSIRKAAIDEMASLHGELYGNDPVSHDHIAAKK